MGQGRGEGAKGMYPITYRLNIVFKLKESEAHGLDTGDKATAQAIAKALQLFPGTDWEFKDLQWLDDNEIEIMLATKPYLDPERVTVTPPAGA
jgi:hypothetical protein